MSIVLPPLPTTDDVILPALGVDTSNALPPAKSIAYIAILEDALEQLTVLADITPEAMKTDNKVVSRFDVVG